MKKAHRRKPFARLDWDRRAKDVPQAAKLRLDSEIFPSEIDVTPEFTGQLLEGDNLSVMAALLPEWEARVDLIYADPPFLSGKSYAARIGRGEDSRRPAEWRTTDGYQDIWRDGSAYLDMLYPRLQHMYQLLSPSGTLYLHLDWHASAYARVLLDEIFGPNRLLNEIVWVYHGPSPIRSAFKRKHDTILVYTKTKDYTFNADAVRVPYDPNTVKTFASSPKAGFGKVPDLDRGKVPEDWWYFPVVARLHKERTGYPTQKPEALMERIIRASSNPGDVVADFFCGSGSTPAIAARLERRWLACDNNPLAISTTYRRLLLEEGMEAFTVWRTQEMSSSLPLTPVIQVKPVGSTITVELVDVVHESDSEAPFPKDINLWEIDWDYDGLIFRSRSQVVRGWRQEEINLECALPMSKSGTFNICVRLIDSQGKIGLSSIQIAI